MPLAFVIRGVIEFTMPTPRTVTKHGGVQKVRMKRMRDGTLVRIYFYKDKKAYNEAVKGSKPNGKTK